MTILHCIVLSTFIQVHMWHVDSGELINSYEGPGRILQTEFNCSGGFLAITSYGEVEILKLKYYETSRKKR